MFEKKTSLFFNNFITSPPRQGGPFRSSAHRMPRPDHMRKRHRIHKTEPRNPGARCALGFLGATEGCSIPFSSSLQAPGLAPTPPRLPCHRLAFREPPSSQGGRERWNSPPHLCGPARPRSAGRSPGTSTARSPLAGQGGPPPQPCRSARRRGRGRGEPRCMLVPEE